MSQLDKTTFQGKYNNSSTGLFKDNTTHDIGADDSRSLVDDIKDSFLNRTDDLLDEDSMSSDSATKVPSQQSVKAYVDNQITTIGSGLVSTWKDAVIVATTANITLSGEQTIDGVLTSSSRVLVKNQTAPAENGIYVSAAGAWARTGDADVAAELEGAAVSVQQGTAQANTNWLQTTDNITLETSPINWIPLGATSPDASPSVKGLAKLYPGTGSNTDGAMDQNSVTDELTAKVPKVLTGNTDITGDFNLSLGTSANHLNALSIYTETQLFLHAQADLTINVHAAVGTDVVGASITPNSFTFAAGVANSTTVVINDENSSTAFSVTANDGNIVLVAATGFSINLTADNINLVGIPTIPTAVVATNNGQAASTKFVHDVIDAETVYFSDSFTGLGTIGSPIDLAPIPATGITGVLGIANGGNGTTTGVSTEVQALLNVKTTATNFAKSVEPTGDVDGVEGVGNMVFTLPDIIVPGSQEVFLNGMLQTEGVDYGMTYPGNVATITFILFAPETGSKLRVHYTRP